MTKQDLIQHVAESAEISKAAASRSLDALLSRIVDALKAGESVNLAGFGSFLTAERPARTGRNPRTGEAIEIPGATVVKFRAAKALKDALNS